MRARPAENPCEPSPTGSHESQDEVAATLNGGCAVLVTHDMPIVLLLGLGSDEPDAPWHFDVPTASITEMAVGGSLLGRTLGDAGQDRLEGLTADRLGAIRNTDARRRPRPATQQDRDLRLVQERTFRERQLGDEQCDREPDTRGEAHAGEVPHPTSSGEAAQPVLVATNDPTATPSGLPSTRPRKMPMPTAPVAASRIDSAESSTPAFARANNGRITKLVHGNSVCSVRAIGETASRESHARRIHQ